MPELLSLLANLSRPRLLIRAARFGTEDYVRKHALPRLLQTPAAPAPKDAISKLMVLEDVQNERRRDGDASYSLNTHIELLIAMMCEARLLRPRQDI